MVSLAERWPSAQQMLDIADCAQKLCKTIRRSLPTTGLNSPFRLPFSASNEGAVHQAIDPLDYLFHGRSLDDLSEDQKTWREQGWMFSPARWIVATPGKRERPDLIEKLSKPPRYIRLFATGTWGWEYAICDPFGAIFRGLAAIKIYLGHGPVFAINDWVKGTDQLRQELGLVKVLWANFRDHAIDHWLGNGWVRNVVFHGEKRPPEVDRIGTYGDPTSGSLGMPVEWVQSVEYYAQALREEVQATTEQQPSMEGEPLVIESNKRFLVALSFPGEHRDFVAKVAHRLGRELGRERVLYDRFHEAEFARPNLDTHLQRLYHDESELVVVFLCADYERKEWPGLEWRAIRDLIKKKQHSSIMPIRLDDADVSGLFSIDGYISVAGRGPTEIAALIIERLRILDQERRPC